MGKEEIVINIWVYSNFSPESTYIFKKKKKIHTIQDKCVRAALRDYKSISGTATEIR